MQAHIYSSELDAMASWMAEFPHHETGGSLFGLFTHTGAPVVHLATGPGPLARHNPASFYQDPAYMEEIHAAVWRDHGLQHLGEWHSHHHLGLAEPSRGDVRTVWDALLPMGWPRFLLGIGNFPGANESHCTFGLTIFDAVRHNWEAVPANVLPGTSPIRWFGNVDYRSPLCRPRPSWSVRDPNAIPEQWFAAPAIRRRLAQELRAFLAIEEVRGLHAEMRAEGDRIVIDLSSDTGPVRIELLAGFPHRAPVIAETLPIREWHSDTLLASWVSDALDTAAVNAATEFAVELDQHISEAVASTTPDLPICPLLRAECRRRAAPPFAARRRRSLVTRAKVHYATR